MRLMEGWFRFELGSTFNIRYVGPSEGVWIILRKLLQDKSHGIVRLPVYLGTIAGQGQQDDEERRNSMMLTGCY